MKVWSFIRKFTKFFKSHFGILPSSSNLMRLHEKALLAKSQNYFDIPFTNEKNVLNSWNFLVNKKDIFVRLKVNFLGILKSRGYIMI